MWYQFGKQDSDIETKRISEALSRLFKAHVDLDHTMWIEMRDGLVVVVCEDCSPGVKAKGARAELVMYYGGYADDHDHVENDDLRHRLRGKCDCGQFYLSHPGARQCYHCLAKAQRLEPCPLCSGPDC